VDVTWLQNDYQLFLPEWGLLVTLRPWWRETKNLHSSNDVFYFLGVCKNTI